MHKRNTMPCLKTTEISKTAALSAALAASLLAAAPASRAVGFRLPNQDPEGIARGNAFAATADNPSAIYYNPAGITQLQGQQARVGLYAISTGVDYKPAKK